jgi:hypothetical protein
MFHSLESSGVIIYHHFMSGDPFMDTIEHHHGGIHFFQVIKLAGFSGYGNNEAVHPAGFQ